MPKIIDQTTEYLVKGCIKNGFTDIACYQYYQSFVNKLAVTVNQNKCP